MAGRWVDVGEAARELGISTDAVRKRISRGSLDSDRPNGHVLVWLDDSETGTGREDQPAIDELLASKDETISILRDQLRIRAEEIQRRDVIISQFTQATSNLTDRLRELETPVKPRDSSESVGEASPEAQTSTTRPDTSTQRRSLWKRMFGR